MSHINYMSVEVKCEVSSRLLVGIMDPGGLEEQ